MTPRERERERERQRERDYDPVKVRKPYKPKQTGHAPL